MPNKVNELRKGEIIIYKSKGGPDLDVRLEKETVWLTQKQMAELFDKDVRTINEHIKNIFKEKELRENSVIRNFRITAADNKSYQTNFYNLDVIISVGYRVKSLRGTQFRIWATKTLKRYLIGGYAINEKRLMEAKGKFLELQKTISFLKDKAGHVLLEGQTQEMLNLLDSYAKSLTILEQYDKNKLKTPKGKRASFVLRDSDAQKLIGKMKNDLVRKKEAGDLFGKDVSLRLDGIIKNIYQTFSGRELYKTLEEKAAHLLYFVIKDHPFIDGNKRIASILFVYFLEKNKYLFKKSGERKINDNALVALALLVATSRPKEKNVIIKIIANLLY